MPKKKAGKDKLIEKLDKFQQRHPVLGFPFAVGKKYSDDEASDRCALITYYGFWSLFPLLLVATTASQLILKSYPHLQEQVTSTLLEYFPIVGQEMQNNIQGVGKTGLALIIGLLIAMYGARGGATAFRNAINHLWQIPRADRGGFPMGPLKSLVIILLGGLGFILATVFSGLATGLGTTPVFRILAISISILVLLSAFLVIFKFAIASSTIRYKDIFLSALIAAIGIQILQTIGGYLINTQLRNLNNLYGTFALVLSILYWIYLQAVVIVYAIEINTVHVLKLWPRSLTQDPMTHQDKKAYKLSAQKERLQPDPPQTVEVKFNAKKTRPK